MSRPLRVEYEGALYHVMNRGNQRQAVFKKHADCETFLEKLGYFAEQFHVDIYCYCIMHNHFHLLLRTRQANLGRFIQSFLTAFTITLNRRNHKSGHLFQGRYKAHLVESRKYLSELSRYIHLNPVRVEKHEESSVEEKRNVLVNYTWSSFPLYIGLKGKPDFLDINPVLSFQDGKKEEKMKGYRKYVEKGLFRDIESPFALAIRQQIIGSETFADKITREKILSKEVKDTREERALIHFQKSIDPEAVITAVAAHFKIDNQAVLKRKSCHRPARRLAIYLCCRYCISHTSLTGIGKLFGISLSGLTRSRDKIAETVGSDTELKKMLEAIKKSITEV